MNHAANAAGSQQPAAPTVPPAPLDKLAHDFRADLLTIQQSPPSNWPRGLLLAICGLVALLILWACFAKLDVIATAQGRLVPMSFTKVVQPAEAGVVLDILVKDGQAVKAGEVLLRLDARLALSELGGLTRDVAIKRLSLSASKLSSPTAPLQLQREHHLMWPHK